MNNSKLAIEHVSLSTEQVDISPLLREREAKVISVLSALREVQDSKEWGVLKEEVFDSLTDTLSREIATEARKETPDTLKLNRLAGQLKWAEKYSNLSSLEQVFKVELSNVRRQLHGTTKENLG